RSSGIATISAAFRTCRDRTLCWLGPHPTAPTTAGDADEPHAGGHRRGGAAVAGYALPASGERAWRRRGLPRAGARRLAERRRRGAGEDPRLYAGLGRGAGRGDAAGSGAAAS